MKSALFTPPGLKPYKIEYLNTSNVLDLIKQGRFDDLPVDIIICHFDNVLKFYNWYTKKQNQLKEIENKKLQERYYQEVFNEDKSYDGMIADDAINEILDFINETK